MRLFSEEVRLFSEMSRLFSEKMRLFNEIDLNERGRKAKVRKAPHMPSQRPKEGLASKGASATTKVALSPAKRRRPVTTAVDSAQMPIPFDLDGWSHGQYVIPTVLLQTALFRIAHKKNDQRPMYEDELLADVKDVGFELRFTGRSLDQYDEDVYLSLIHNAKHRGFGARIPVTLRGLLRDMGYNDGGANCLRLKASFKRLVNANVYIKFGGLKYVGHLVESILSDEAAGETYAFRLNTDMAKLFATENRTALQSNERQSIKYPAARWLHTVLEASNEDHLVLSKVKLWQRSGSLCKAVYHFTPILTKALGELKSLNFITRYKIDGDLVIIERMPRALRLSQGSSASLRALRTAQI